MIPNIRQGIGENITQGIIDFAEKGDLCFSTPGKGTVRVLLGATYLGNGIAFKILSCLYNQKEYNQNANKMMDKGATFLLSGTSQCIIEVCFVGFVGSVIRMTIYGTGPIMEPT